MTRRLDRWQRGERADRWLVALTQREERADRHVADDELRTDELAVLGDANRAHLA